MKKMIVKTGFGFIKDSKGNVVAKCELPPGEHPLKDDFVYCEVLGREALDRVEVVSGVPEERVLAKRVRDRMFRDIRIRAIKELKEEGLLPQNY